MIDWSDNGGYLLLGLMAFWLPTLGYLGWMRLRQSRAAEEAQLLQEEMET